MADDGGSSTCNHGPSCCKICRDDISKLRSELNILRFQLQVPAGRKTVGSFALSGLEGSDATEQSNIEQCLDVIEINTEGKATRYKVKDGILDALKPHKNDRPYVARRLTDLLFTKVERTTSNVKGLKNKKMLDPQRMAAVKDGTFKVCEAKKEDQAALWKECIRSIDSASRGLGRDRKKNPTKRLQAAAASSSSSNNTSASNAAIVGSQSLATGVTTVMPVTIPAAVVSAGAVTGQQIPVSCNGDAIRVAVPTVRDQSDGGPPSKIITLQPVIGTGTANLVDGRPTTGPTPAPVIYTSLP